MINKPEQYKKQMGKLAIINIFSSKNNTKILATDITGCETIAKATGGMMVKTAREEGKPYAAMQGALLIADQLKLKGFTRVIVKVRATGGHGSKSPGSGAQAAIRQLARSGIRIERIDDVTPIPTDTTRRPGGKRGRRV